MAKKKKKNGLNTPMLVLSAVALVVFVVFVALTIRNIFKQEQQPVMEEVPFTQNRTQINTDYTSDARSLLGELQINYGNTEFLPDFYRRQGFCAEKDIVLMGMEL